MYQFGKIHDAATLAQVTGMWGSGNILQSDVTILTRLWRVIVTSFENYYSTFFSTHANLKFAFFLFDFAGLAWIDILYHVLMAIGAVDRYNLIYNNYVCLSSIIISVLLWNVHKGYTGMMADDWEILTTIAYHPYNKHPCGLTN